MRVALCDDYKDERENISTIMEYQFMGSNPCEKPEVLYMKQCIKK